ncbi:MAG: hypothetical protein AB7S78_04855 [Candidatus Omnitrophota bacterium]
MLKILKNSFLIIGIISFPHTAWAGAGLDQRLRAVQQQRAQQQQIQQQALLRQRQAAVTQQVAQRQIQVMQQQMALQQAAQVGQQQLIRQQLQQQAIYQQQQAYNQALQERQHMQQQLAQNHPDANRFSSGGPSYEPYVEEVVDMAVLWEDLKISSEAWPLIIDMGAKEIIVAKFIEDYRLEGVTIKKDPRHYAQLIDAMSFDQPEMLKNSFDKLLQIVAIIEYDFNNGANPDLMARQILGDQGYQQNKKRLGK